MSHQVGVCCTILCTCFSGSVADERANRIQWRKLHAANAGTAILVLMEQANALTWWDKCECSVSSSQNQHRLQHTLVVPWISISYMFHYVAIRIRHIYSLNYFITTKMSYRIFGRPHCLQALESQWVSAIEKLKKRGLFACSCVYYSTTSQFITHKFQTKWIN